MAGDQDWQKGYIPMGKDVTRDQGLEDNMPSPQNETVVGGDAIARQKPVSDRPAQSNPRNR